MIIIEDQNKNVLGKNLTFYKYINITPDFEYIVKDIKSVKCLKNEYSFGIIGEINKIFVGSFIFNFTINPSSFIKAKCQYSFIYFNKKTMINCKIKLLNNNIFLANLNKGIVLKENYFRVYNDEGEKILKFELGNNKDIIELKQLSCKEENKYNNAINEELYKKIKDKNNKETKNKSIYEDEEKINEIKNSEINNRKIEEINNLSTIHNNSLENKEFNINKNNTKKEIIPNNNLTKNYNTIHNRKEKKIIKDNIKTINNTEKGELHNKNKEIKNPIIMNENKTAINKKDSISYNLKENNSFTNISERANEKEKIKENENYKGKNKKIKINITFNETLKKEIIEKQNNQIFENNETLNIQNENITHEIYIAKENKNEGKKKNNNNLTEKFTSEKYINLNKTKNNYLDSIANNNKIENNTLENISKNNMTQNNKSEIIKNNNISQNNSLENIKNNVISNISDILNISNYTLIESKIENKNLTNNINNNISYNNYINQNIIKKNEEEFINKNNIDVKLIHKQFRYNFGILYYMFYSLTQIPKGHEIKINISIFKYNNMLELHNENKFIILKTEEEISKEDTNIIVEYKANLECKDCRKIILNNIEGAKIYKIPEQEFLRDAIAVNRNNYISKLDIKSPLLYITDNITNQNCIIDLGGKFFNKNNGFLTKFDLLLINSGNFNIIKKNITAFCILNEINFTCPITDYLINYQYKLEQFIIDEKENIIIDNSLVTNIISNVSCVNELALVKNNEYKVEEKKISKKKIIIIIWLIIILIILFIIIDYYFCYENPPEYKYSSSSTGILPNKSNYVSETSTLINKRWW